MKTMLRTALFATAVLAATPGLAAPTVAYGGTGATSGIVGGMLNIGRTFAVTGKGVNVSALGVFNFGGAGLATSHTVSVFSLGSSTPTFLFSTVVGSGTAGTLVDGFRFASLGSSQYLAAGNYAVIAYGLASSGDPYGDGGTLPSGGNVSDLGFDPFQFNGAASPAYPNGGDGNSHSSASFQYTSAVPEPATWAMMLLGFGMVGFGLRSRKRPAITVTYA